MSDRGGGRRPLPDDLAFYTINDLIAAGYGSRTTIWREIQRGELPAVKTSSGRVLVPRDGFVIYLHDHAIGKTTI